MTDLSVRQTNKAARRARILDAAAGMMAAGGVQALSLRELAAASGVTVPTIYNLIGSREDLIREIISDALDQLDDVLAGLPEQKGVEFGLAAIDELFRLVMADKNVYRAVFRALYEFEAPNMPDWLGRMFRRGGDVMLSAVTRAVDDGDLRGELAPLPLAHNAFHALQATLHMWATGGLNSRNSQARARYAFLVTLLADATPRGRRRLRALMADAEQILDR